MFYILILLLSLLLFPLSLFAQYSEIDSTVASINGEAVTAFDLKKKMGKKDFSQSDLKDFLLEDMLEKEAATSGAAVKDQDVDLYINQIKKQNKINDQQFEAALEQKGLTLPAYRETIKGEILKSRTMARLIGKKIEISEQEIEDYLIKNPKLQPKKGTVKLNYIKSSSRKKLEQLKAEALDNAKKLRELGAKGYNDLGYVKLNELREDFKRAIAKMSKGDVSEIINIGSGNYVILELLAKIERAGNYDDNLKNYVKEIIYREKYKQAVQGVMTKDLMDKHNFEIIGR